MERLYSSSTPTHLSLICPLTGFTPLSLVTNCLNSYEDWSNWDTITFFLSPPPFTYRSWDYHFHRLDTWASSNPLIKQTEGGRRFLIWPENGGKHVLMTPLPPQWLSSTHLFLKVNDVYNRRQCFVSDSSRNSLSVSGFLHLDLIILTYLLVSSLCVSGSPSPSLFLSSL